MTISTIKVATASDEAGVIGVLTLAFSSDPMARWAQPDPHRYLTHFPSIAKAFGGTAFAQDTAYFAAGYAGAALWLQPGFGPDEETMIGLVERTAPEGIKDEIFGVFEQMAKYHPTPLSLAIAMARLPILNRQIPGISRSMKDTVSR
jgi:hypothetical protein